MPLRRAGAECVGTFVLVFGGVGTAVIAGEAVGNLGVAFAFGLALLAMAYAIGPVSGCHINPAVTLGLLVSRRITLPEAARYWAAQVLGAIVAAALLLVIAKARAGGYDAEAEGFGANGYGDHSPEGYGAGAAFVAEVVLTAFLVFTVLVGDGPDRQRRLRGDPDRPRADADPPRRDPDHQHLGQPARSIGPALFVGGWALEQLWMFIVAPLVGALLGAVLHRALFAEVVPIAPEESAVASEPAEGQAAV